MSRRKGLALMAAMLAASGFAWSLTGGMTVAQGQEQQVYINRAHAGSAKPSFNKPIFVLALGSDQGSRKYGRGGSVDHGRADSIHVIAIEPRTKKITIIGIPRDSYVPLACGSGANKINAAMFFGGTSCVVRTIENYSGGVLKFDYYMVTGFEQMENMVNDLGGVIVTVDRGDEGVLTDRPSRAQGIRPGTQTLNGHDALAYSRDRHDYDRLRGDFARSAHQGQVMIGALAKARIEVAKKPGLTLTYLRSMFRNIKTDVGVIEAFRIGLLLLQADPKNVTNIVMPGTTGSTPAGSSVLLSSEARTILRDLAADGLLS